MHAVPKNKKAPEMAPGDELSELEFLRCRVANEDMQNLQRLFEVHPDFIAANNALKAAVAAVAKAHGLDMDAGDSIDLRARKIVRAQRPTK